jgi:ribosomal protein S12
MPTGTANASSHSPVMIEGFGTRDLHGVGKTHQIRCSLLPVVSFTSPRLEKGGAM